MHLSEAFDIKKKIRKTRAWWRTRQSILYFHSAVPTDLIYICAFPSPSIDCPFVTRGCPLMQNVKTSFIVNETFTTASSFKNDSESWSNSGGIMFKSLMNETMNCSEASSLYNHTKQGMQELQFSLRWVVTLSCLYAATTILSVFGNVMVILVFFKGRQSKTDLRPYLVNLAVADLIMAVFCMPFTFGDVVFRSWIFSEPMCPVVIFMQTISVSASVFINVAIGIDRLLVVLFPLKCKRSKSRTKLVLLFIWLMSLILACMVAPVGRVQHDNGRYLCQEVWPSHKHNQTFTILIFILTYALPLLVLMISYSIVGIILWKRTSPGNRDHVRDLLQLRAKVKVGYCLYF